MATINKDVEYTLALRDRFSKNMDKITSSFKKFGKQVEQTGKRLTLFATLPILALSGVSVKAASDFEETQSKFDVVFSSLGEKANEFAVNFAKNFGLSELASKGVLSATGDLLTGFGFTQQAAFDLTKQVNILAADLASFTNFQGGTEAASIALTKALLGETESAKALGIVIRQDTEEWNDNVEQLMRTQGITKLQAKALTALKIATEQSKNSIGDFSRTIQSFANQSRITRARLEDLSVQIGQILMPLAQRLLKIVSGWIERFIALDKSTKKIILIIAGLVAAIGPLMVIFGLLIGTVIPALITGFTTLFAIMAANPILAIVGVVGLAISAFVLWNKTTGKSAKMLGQLQKITDRYNKTLIKEQAALNTLFKIAKNENVSKETRAQAIRMINDQYGSYLPNLLSEKSSVEDIQKAQDGANTALIRSIRIKQKTSELTGIETKRLQEERMAFQLISKDAGAFADVTFDAFRKMIEGFQSFDATVSDLGQGAVGVTFSKDAQKRVDEFGTNYGITFDNMTSAAANLITANREAAKSNRIVQSFFGKDVLQTFTTKVDQGSAQRALAGITKITSAAPKIFNINIGSLVEGGVNIQPTNFTEGMQQVRDIVTEVFLGMLADVQVNR